MPDQNAPAWLSGRSILVVEDEFLLAEDLREQLVLAGAAVIGPVATLAKALDLIAAGVALDAAVLDVNLGGQKVFPLADLLQEQGVPCVFVTGYDRSMIPAAYSNIRICRKPASAREVANALASV